jgi:succinate dehydrogenase/fumarate reductase flavoprotein subunit
MWENCGLVRDRNGLARAIDQIDELIEQADQVAVAGPPQANYGWQEALDVRNQLTVARTMVVAALAREESRGAHFRSDFPEQDDERWLRSIVVRRGENGRPELDSRPVALSRLRPDLAVPAGVAG